MPVVWSRESLDLIPLGPRAMGWYANANIEYILDQNGSEVLDVLPVLPKKKQFRQESRLELAIAEAKETIREKVVEPVREKVRAGAEPVWNKVSGVMSMAVDLAEKMADATWNRLPVNLRRTMVITVTAAVLWACNAADAMGVPSQVPDGGTDLPRPGVTVVDEEETAVPTPSRPDLSQGAGGRYSDGQIKLIENGQFRGQEEVLSRWVKDYWGLAENRPFNPESVDLHYIYVFDNKNRARAGVLLQAGGDYAGRTFTIPIKDGQYMQTPPNPSGGEFDIPTGFGPLELSGGNEELVLGYRLGAWVRLDQAGNVAETLNLKTAQWEKVGVVKPVVTEVPQPTSETGIVVDAADPYKVVLNGVSAEEIKKADADKSGELAPKLDPGAYWGLENKELNYSQKVSLADKTYLLYKDETDKVQMGVRVETGEVLRMNRSEWIDPESGYKTTVYLATENEWTRDRGWQFPMNEAEPGVIARGFFTEIFAWNNIYTNYYNSLLQQLSENGMASFDINHMSLEQVKNYRFNLDGEYLKPVEILRKDLAVLTDGEKLKMQLGWKMGGKVAIGKSETTLLVDATYDKWMPSGSWTTRDQWFTGHSFHQISQADDGTVGIFVRLNEKIISRNWGGRFIGKWFGGLVREIMMGSKFSGIGTKGEIYVIRSLQDPLFFSLCGPELDLYLKQLEKVNGGIYSGFYTRQVPPRADVIHETPECGVATLRR